MKTIKKNDKNKVKLMEELIHFNIENHYKKTENIVLVFIGTDKCTGGSLGPLIGTKLGKIKGIKDKVKIYGTLKSPVCAIDIDDVFKEIDKENSLVIVTYASLGDKSEIGDILIDTGSISPIVSFGKDLDSNGDISINAIVGEACKESDFEVSFDTGLSIVYDLAEEIELSLSSALERC